MNIYETVTTRILSQLAAGVIPWRKTWQAGLPKSLVSKREYRGINLLVLGSSEYASRYWLTFRQTQHLGGHVRKGEHATPIVYWKWRTAEELAKLAATTGKENLAPCVPFVSQVFNLEQVEGITRPEDDVPNPANRRLEIAEQMMEVMPDKPQLLHTLTSRPAYCPALDQITLPHLSQFESAEHYYAVFWHELTHAVGHPKRLNRFSDAQRDQPEKYSFEELVAEMGAAFLCGFAGIQNPGTEALQVSYIEGWSRVFQQDARVLMRAASAAQRAVDYIRGKLPAAEEPIAAAA
jgi:antirestriction protein ArdC